jgi:hypothetical protein
MNNSATYRKAAAACRKTAKSSSTPAEWLGFAADWDRMAEQAESLSAQEVAFDDAVSVQIRSQSFAPTLQHEYVGRQ